METLNLSFRDNLQNPFSLFHRVFPGLSVGFSPVSIGMENFPKGCRSVGGGAAGAGGACAAGGAAAGGAAEYDEYEDYDDELEFYVPADGVAGDYEI